MPKKSPKPKPEPETPEVPNEGYLPELVINKAHAKIFPSNCAVILRAGNGRSVGACWHYLKDGHTCETHGKVKI